MRFWVVLGWLAASAPVTLSAQDRPQGAPQGTLALGDTAVRTLKASTTHRWQLTAARGQFVALDVSQLGIDVIVRVFSPDGRQRWEVDRTDAPQAELATWIADTPGRWSITLTPLAEPGDSGRYAIVLRASRAATPRDRQVVEADSLNLRALRLEDDGAPAEAEQLHRRALVMYEALHGAEAAELLFPLDDLARVIEQQRRLVEAEPFRVRALEITIRTLGAVHPDVAAAAMQLGSLNINAARYPEALTFYQQALDAYTALYGPWDRNVAAALSELGRAQSRMARYSAAETYYRRALTIYDSILAPEDPLQAPTLNNLAVLYVAQARFKDASVMYQRVIDINTAARGPDDLQVAIGQYNLAALLVRWARLDEAEPLYRRSLETHLRTFGPMHRSVGQVYLGLAELAERRSDYAEAGQLYRRAFAIFDSVLPPGHPDIAAAWIGRGHVYQRQGSIGEAEAAYRTAIDDLEKNLGPQHPIVAEALGDLTALYLEQGDFGRADSLAARVTAIDEANFGPDHPQVAWSLRTRARSEDDQGRPEAAIPLWSRALQIFEANFGADHPDVALTLAGLAHAELMAGRISQDSALALLDRTVNIYEAASDNTGRIIGYAARAELQHHRGDDRRAIADLDEALLAIDDDRARIGGDEETRATYFSSFSELYSRMIAWQLAAGDTATAFTFAERGRARVLLDQLAAGKVDIRGSIPADLRAELERREGDAESRLAELQQRITLLRSRDDLPDAERLQRIATLGDSLRLADASYQQVYADIKNASPLWRDQVTSGGRPSSLSEIQRSVVPRDGLLLSYQIGTEGSVVFVIPPSGGRVQAMSLTIPTDAATTLGVNPGPLTAAVLQTVLAGDTTTGSGGGLFYDLSTAARGSKVVGRRAPLAPEARLYALWQVLLPKTVWQQVLGATDVVIIPDGPLHYLPFVALVVDTTRTADGVRYWLDDGPPTRYAGSATALVNVTRRPAARAVRTATGPMMLSLSDPIFDPSELGRGTDATAPGATRDAFVRSGASLARLPGTAQETELVRGAMGAGAASRLAVLEGARATEANLRASLDGIRFLHLATHGLVDQQRGTLFASLALTPPAGETSDAANDGFWQLHEIYNARLPELELAVLSACQSNIGLNILGEGVFALSRGFTTAGARRVVATQWSVDDASTAALVGDFFQHVLTEERQGKQVGYAVALRDAQRAVRSQAKWRDPFYWAPFILTGKQ